MPLSVKLVAFFPRYPLENRLKIRYEYVIQAMTENKIFSVNPTYFSIITKGAPLIKDSVSSIKPKMINSNITFSIFSMGGNIVKKGVFCTYLSLFS